jgi:membrane protein
MGDEAIADARSQPRAVVIAYRAAGRLRGADMSSVAAEAAYFSILAIAPFLIFLIALISIVLQSANVAVADEIEEIVLRMAPGESGELLVPLIEQAIERADRGTTSFGMLSAAVIAMWSSSRAIQALLKGFNRIYRVERDRPPLWGRTVSMFLAVLLAGLLTISAVTFLFGGAVGRWLSRGLGFGDTFSVLWQILSWPVAAAILVLMLSLLYSFGPNTTVRTGFPSAGALVATALWLLIMVGLRIYIVLVEPGSIYGALSTFVLLVVFFYVTSIALLLGAAVNASLDQHVKDREATDTG